MKKVLMFFATVSLCLMTVTVWADTLEMKDGRFLEGQYLGGTQNSIRFQVEKQIQVFPVRDVLALTFSASPGGTSSGFPTGGAQMNTPKPKPQQTPEIKGEIVLEPGTKVAVRMLESLYLENSRKDDWFRASLESDVRVNGVTVLPKGAKINGQVVASEQGKMGSTLAITLREVVVDNQVVSLSTSNYMVKNEARNVLDLGISSLKIVKRDRDLQIPHQSVVEFETLEPIEFRRAQ